MHHNNKKVRALLGLRIRQLRKSLGMTQEQLAARCDIFRPYLSRIESGSANPSLLVLTALAQCLHVSVHDLLAVGNGNSHNHVALPDVTIE